MVLTVTRTTVQLLDDCNLQAVAVVGHDESRGGEGARGTAARATTEGRPPGVMDGWIGGTWVSAECHNLFFGDVYSDV